MTSSRRLKVHHMAEQHGLARIAERVFFLAELQPSEADGAFAPLPETEIPEAVALALAAESTTLTGPLVDVGWRFGTPTNELFGKFLRREEAQAYWWGDRKGLLLAWEDEWDEGRFLLVSLVACSLRDVPALLMDLRGLGAARGVHAVGWNAELQPEMTAALVGAGFSREDDHSAYIFARQHPSRP
jgi:hypothetical protein